MTGTGGCCVPCCHRGKVEQITISPEIEWQGHTIQPEWREAAFLIDDAIHCRGLFGRAKASTLPPYRRRCFAWVANNRLRHATFLFIVIHCSLAIWEPKQAHIQPGQTHPAVWILHVLCLIFYVVDVTIHLIFFGCNDFWKINQTRRYRGEFVLTCLFLVDFLLFIVQEVTKTRLGPPFRFLRCSMLICKSKSCEHIFMVTIYVSIRLAKILFIFIVFLLLFGAIGVHLYARDYHFIGCAGAPNCNDTWLTNPYTGSFDHVGPAFIRIFGLLTTENYPEIMTPPFKRAQGNVAFFVLVLYLSNYILLAILLAVIVNIYWETAKKIVKQDREEQRMAAAKAWDILVPDGQSDLPITSSAFYGVLHLYNPKYTLKEISEILKYLDLRNKERIHVCHWTIYLCKALSFKYIFEEDNEDPVSLSQSLKHIREFLLSKFYYFSIATLIIIYSVLFAVEWYEMPKITKLGIQIIRTIISLFFLVEFCLTLSVRSLSRFKSRTKIVQLVLIAISTLAMFAWYLNWFVPVISRDYYFGIMTTIETLAILARLPLHLNLLRKIRSIFMACVPVMFTLAAVLFVVLYGYSMIGLEAFVGRRQPKKDEGIDPGHYDYGCGLGFETFLCSCLVVFQILVTNDWHAVQNAVMTSVKSKWPAAYFITCFVIINYVMSNLLVAIAIEAYNKLGRRKEKGKKKLEKKPKHAQDAGVDEPTDLSYLERRRQSLSAELQQRNNEAFKHLPNIKSTPRSTDNSENEEEMQENVPVSAEVLRDRVRRRRKQSRRKIKVIMAYRKKNDGEINLHKDDMITKIFEHRKYIRGTTSRGRTGWFPAECIDLGRKREVSTEQRGSAPVGNDLSSMKLNIQNDQPTTSSGRGARMKLERADWKQDILGDITVLNEDEAIRLNQIIRADMWTPRQLDTDVHESDEDEYFDEESSLETGRSADENDTLCPVEIHVQEIPDVNSSAAESSQNTKEPDSDVGITAAVQFLSLPKMPSARKSTEKSAEPRSGHSKSSQDKNESNGVPEWAKKFLNQGPVPLRTSSDISVRALQDTDLDETPKEPDAPVPPTELSNDDSPKQLTAKREERDERKNGFSAPEPDDSKDILISVEEVDEQDSAGKRDESFLSPSGDTRETNIDDDARVTLAMVETGSVGSTHHVKFRFDVA